MAPESQYWTPVRIALWAGVAVLVSVWLGPKFVAAFRPPDRALMDFIQEWLSARNFRSGTPVYADQTEALWRHAGMTPADGEKMLPWNAHPPASILLALPFAGLPYDRAQFAWNLATFPLLVLSVAVVVRELGIPFRLASLFPAVALTLVCQPVYIQLLQGQLNAVLLPFLVATWVTARRGYAGWAGVAIGVAAAIKAFPAFLAVYLIVNRRWVGLATAAGAFLVVNGVALALFGSGAFETYAREVVPSVTEYQSSWRNVSVSGFWMRIFDPKEPERVLPLVSAPLVGRAVATAFQLAVVAVVVWACRRAPEGERADRAFAVAVVGMLLVSPISWTHYFLLLPIPLAVLWLRLTGPARWGMWAVFVLLWLPDNFVPLLVLGRDQAAAMARNLHRPLTPAENLFAASVPHYALIGLFLLTILVPVPPAPEARARHPRESARAGADDERLNRRLFGELGPPPAG